MVFDADLLIVISPWASLPTVERQCLREQDRTQLEDSWSQSPELHTVGPQHQLFGSTNSLLLLCRACYVDTA